MVYIDPAIGCCLISQRPVGIARFFRHTRKPSLYAMPSSDSDPKSRIEPDQ